jgi:uncharacterized protein DUF6328
MPELKSKIEDALNESRILVLGMQVLIGAQYNSAFASGFQKLPNVSQGLMVGALAPLLLAMTLMMAPAPYHQLVARGQNTRPFLEFTNRMLALAPFPFAVALGIDLYVVTEKVAGLAWGVVGGLAGGLLALFFWYGLEMLSRGRHEHAAASVRQERNKPAKDTPMNDQTPQPEGEHTPTETKVKNVLTEARVILPGVQALLGFQINTMLSDGFDKLPESSKYIHLTSLALMAISIILLMTPAPYHRIVERGEDTEHFQRFTSRLILAAMVPLALGLSGDFFVLVRKVSESALAAGVAAGLLLVVFYVAWFGFTFYRRAQQQPETAEG